MVISLMSGGAKSETKNIVSSIGDAFLYQGRGALPMWSFEMESNGDIRWELIIASSRMKPLSKEYTIFKYPDGNLWIKVFKKAIEWRKVAKSKKIEIIKEMPSPFEGLKVLFEAKKKGKEAYVYIVNDKWLPNEIRMEIAGRKFKSTLSKLKKEFKRVTKKIDSNKKNGDLFR